MPYEIEEANRARVLWPAPRPPYEEEDYLQRTHTSTDRKTRGNVRVDWFSGLRWACGATGGVALARVPAKEVMRPRPGADDARKLAPNTGTSGSVPYREPGLRLGWDPQASALTTVSLVNSLTLWSGKFSISDPLCDQKMAIDQAITALGLVKPFAILIPVVGNSLQGAIEVLQEACKFTKVRASQASS